MPVMADQLHIYDLTLMGRCHSCSCCFVGNRLIRCRWTVGHGTVLALMFTAATERLRV